MALKIKHRCRFCGHVLREDGTCPNQECPRYTPEPEKPANETPKTEESEDEQ